MVCFPVRQSKAENRPTASLTSCRLNQFSFLPTQGTHMQHARRIGECSPVKPRISQPVSELALCDCARTARTNAIEIGYSTLRPSPRLRRPRSFVHTSTSGCARTDGVLKISPLAQSGSAKTSSAEPRLGTGISGVNWRTTRLPIRLGPTGIATYCLRPAK
jgi:hypothetical protein